MSSLWCGRSLPQKARAEALALYKGGGAGPKPWFLEEDYTDRHGSFWTHGGQWCACSMSPGTQSQDTSSYKTTRVAC